MRLRIAEVHQQAVTKVLCNVAVKALDHCGAGGLIGAYDPSVVFRVKLSGEGGRVYQITKQHRELPAFRLEAPSEVGEGASWGGESSRADG